MRKPTPGFFCANQAWHTSPVPVWQLEGLLPDLVYSLYGIDGAILHLCRAHATCQVPCLKMYPEDIMIVAPGPSSYCQVPGLTASLDPSPNCTTGCVPQNAYLSFGWLGLAIVSAPKAAFSLSSSSAGGLSPDIVPGRGCKLIKEGERTSWALLHFETRRHYATR